MNSQGFSLVSNGFVGDSAQDFNGPVLRRKVQPKPHEVVDVSSVSSPDQDSILADVDGLGLKGRLVQNFDTQFCTYPWSSKLSALLSPLAHEIGKTGSTTRDPGLEALNACWPWPFLLPEQPSRRRLGSKPEETPKRSCISWT